MDAVATTKEAARDDLEADDREAEGRRVVIRRRGEVNDIEFVGLSPSEARRRFGRQLSIEEAVARDLANERAPVEPCQSDRP
jgi:hypothetical protein